jgi:hypothetical protein
MPYPFVIFTHMERLKHLKDPIEIDFFKSDAIILDGVIIPGCAELVLADHGNWQLVRCRSRHRR